ncbi:MAG: hypothetical protein HUN04_25695 [Desulfobacter sp.]|nr:MAG: hypothetical protein HUN04_25695 [Desulfobacter sp.]
MRIILCVMIMLTTGCAMYPASSDGEFVTFKHGKALFSVAKSNAEKECATIDKMAKHDRTDCFQEACTSTFMCFGNIQKEKE